MGARRKKSSEHQQQGVQADLGEEPNPQATDVEAMITPLIRLQVNHFSCQKEKVGPGAFERFTREYLRE